MGTYAMSALTPDNEALLAAFLAEETARGRRPRGVDVLRYNARYFLTFLEERGKRAEEITFADAVEYQGAIIERRTKSGGAYVMSTVSSIVLAASAWCDYLARTGKLIDNPFKDVRRVRVRSKVPEGILAEREMNGLLATLRNWTGGGDLWQVKRRYITHVIAELQYASGLRIAEVAALTPDDVDVERALVHVKDGKQGSNRVGFLTDYAACVLERYLQSARPALLSRMDEPHEERLFLKVPVRLTQMVNFELARACREAGLRVIGSHGFRHALGYHLLRSGCPLRYIQAILGHKRIENTEVYTKVDAEDVKRVFDACHPRMYSSLRMYA